MDKRTSALDNIRALLTHIEEAKSNAEVRKKMHRLHQIILCASDVMRVSGCRFWRPTNLG
jgi:hypothetical protein